MSVISALALVGKKKLPIAATIAGGAALGTSEESEAKVLTTIPNLIRLGMLTPDSAKNPSAVKSAHTKYNKALKESKAFKAREKLREDIENKTQSLDLGGIQTLDPNTLVGKVGVPVTGDTSVTGKTINTIGGVELDAPVYVEGGPQFPKRFQDQGYGWASMQDAANKKQTNIERAREATEGADPVGIFSAMSREAINFSTPIAEALYKQAINLPLTAKDVKEFDRYLRHGPRGSQAKKQKGIKDWVGLNHPDALDQLLGLGDYPQRGAGEIRKQFVETMELSQFRDRGFPIKEDVYAEAIEPALQTAKPGDAGFSVFKAAPDQSTFQAPVHQSYDTVIPGEYLGQFEQNIPSRIMFPEIYKKLDTQTNYKGEPLTEQQKLGSLMMRNDLYEPFTEQWADEVSNYMRLPRGSADPKLLGALAGGSSLAAGGLLMSNDEAAKSKTPKVDFLSEEEKQAIADKMKLRQTGEIMALDYPSLYNLGRTLNKFDTPFGNPIGGVADLLEHLGTGGIDSKSNYSETGIPRYDLTGKKGLWAALDFL